MGDIKMCYIIRKAVTNDMPRLLEIYASARKFMAENGNPTQWPANYPNGEMLREDMAAGVLYAVCDGETVRGVFLFRIGEDPTYRKIYEGDWHSDRAYGVIHRIAGDGAGGIFQAALDFCSQRADYLRIDTHENNRVMLGKLEKAGFRRCGIIYLANGDARIAFDCERYGRGGS